MAANLRMSFSVPCELLSAATTSRDAGVEKELSELTLYLERSMPRVDQTNSLVAHGHGLNDCQIPPSQ